MKILVVISSLDRSKELLQCLDSLFKQKVKLSVSINWSINPDNENKLPNSFTNQEIRLRNFDIVLPICDDVVLDDECLLKAIYDMDKVFPGYCGVVGIEQRNIDSDDKCPAAFSLIGKKFINEFFGEHELFCPAYFHWWADRELYEFSVKVNRFFMSKSSLVHNHPSFSGRRNDLAHNNLRGDVYNRDMDTRKARKSKGLLWGSSFELS